MKRFLLLFSLFPFLLLLGQQYQSFWYNTDNGLPQNSIKDIIKDKYGFIWLSTDGGIVRYDGKDFITYKNLKISNFNFFFFLGQPQTDHIVIPNAAEREYLVIKNRKIKVYKPDSQEIKEDVNRIYHQGKEYIFFSKNNSQFAITSPSRAFIGFKSGMYLFEDGKNIVYLKKNSSEEITIPFLFKMKNLKNFFGFGETLFLRDPERKKIIQFEADKISDFPCDDPLYTDPASRIYWQKTINQNFIINKGVIYISTLQNGTLKAIPLIRLKNSDIDIASIYSILFDKESRSIYLGTVNKGLNIIKIPSFTTPELAPTVEYRVQYTMLPFGKDQIINIQGRIFKRHSLVKDYHFNTFDELGALYDEKKNILFVSSSNHRIYRRYAPDYKKYDSLSSDKTRFPILVFKDRESYMQLHSDNIRFYLVIYKDSNFDKPEYIFPFDNLIYSAMHIDHDRLLVGLIDGLYLVSKSKRTIKKIRTPSLNVKNIISTESGNVWIITRGKGFYLFKNNRLIKMPYDENAYLSYPHNVIRDKKGFLWIPSNNGLFKVPESSLLEYAKNNTKKVFYYRYTKDDGFKINEFNGAGTSSCFAELENGDFVLPSMDGYVFFNPLQTPSYYPKAKNIYIERAKIKNSDFIYFKDTLNLKNDFEDTSVFIDTPYFSNNDNLYMEAGFRNEENNIKWNKLRNREYSIPHLSPGLYTLYIRTLISPTGHFTYKKILINVPALFYQTTWFRTVVILIFIGLIIFLIRLRTQFLQKKNTTLKKIVHQKNDELKITQDQLKNEAEYQKDLIQTINHDITTPIKYLSVMSQKLSETDNINLQKQYFDTIHKSSEELYKFTLNLKNYTELFSSQAQKYQENEYSISEILEEKKNLFAQIAAQNNIIINNIAPLNIVLNINESMMSAIIHNLVDNAVKNTFEGEIILNAEEKEYQIIISVTDSGVGMKEDVLEYYNSLINNIKNKPSSFKSQGLGLHLVIQLLKKIDGSIRFKPHHPKGTRVEITIQKP
ncbi:ATP-binding protein [Chryseobacterium sp. PMSZPI]|uniref:ligand-binding sensor domain-containing protein n=1 Tax=Chryseobacterium sp. PMSZPI TaxID=1033900 RepID=UPI000C335D84|nr:HAMP domain-containing sensor histidine kinase [Chryseobacterium sp. PMSZPI]PKF73615.1 hypothetical protein CW752_13720 [Chryseobacterium sp. PMSZPI]